MKNLTQRKNDFADLLKECDVTKFDDAFKSLNRMFNDFNKNANKVFTDFRNNVSSFLNDFDFEDVEKAIEDGKSKFTEHFKRVTNGNFEVVTSFDKDEDDLSFKLDGDEFSVNVKAKDGSGASNLVTTIPNDVDKHSVVQKYDALNKKIRFIFKKK